MLTIGSYATLHPFNMHGVITAEDESTFTLTKPNGETQKAPKGLFTEDQRTDAVAVLEDNGYTI